MFRKILVSFPFPKLSKKVVVLLLGCEGDLHPLER